MRLIGPGHAIEARRQKRQLVGIGDGEMFRDMAEAVPRGAGGEGPIARIGGEFLVGNPPMASAPRPRPPSRHS